MAAKVVVRIRPFINKEEGQHVELAVKIKIGPQGGLKLVLTTAHQQQEIFHFDQVYSSHKQYTENDSSHLCPTMVYNAPSADQFLDLGKRLFRYIWKGYNCTVFAYGQSGSGKSISLFGKRDTSQIGLIEAFCSRLFEQIDSTSIKGVLCHTSLAMYEIYNEQVRDLLDCQIKIVNPKIKLTENFTGKITKYYVEDLQWLAITSITDAMTALNEGTKNQAHFTSELNSAKKCQATIIVQLQFVQKFQNKNGQLMRKESLISFVDLPGSETLKQVTLTSLHSVVKASNTPNDEKKESSLSDSVLTKLLKTELEGNSKITLIATLSPAEKDYKLSLETLTFAEKVKNIDTNARVNEMPCGTLLYQLREENSQLFSMLQMGSGDSMFRYLYPEKFCAEKKSERKAVLKIIEQNLKDIKELQKAWQDKLSDSQKLLQKFSESKLEYEQYKDTVPHLWNIHEDPQLTKTIIHFLHLGLNYIGHQNIENKITLSGFSIRPVHAVIANEGLNLTLNPCSSNARVLVNGQLIHDQVTLHHNDRIIFGCHHVYSVYHPSETKVHRQTQITYNKALEDIAILSGYNPKEKHLLSSSNNEDYKEQILTIIPKVFEANFLSEELDKKVSLEIVIIKPQARIIKNTEVMVRIKNLTTEKTRLWDLADFSQRHFSMLDMYHMYINGYAIIDKKDPFYATDCTDSLIGEAHVYMQYLPHMIEMESNVDVFNICGEKQGQLCVIITPCTSDGSIHKEDILIENTTDILEGTVHFQLTIKYAKNLQAENTKAGVYCMVKHHYTNYRTQTLTGTSMLHFNYKQHMFIDCVTYSTLSTLKCEPLVIEVWAKDKSDYWSFFTEGTVDFIRSQLTTGELMNLEIQRKESVLSIKTIEKQTQQIESEIMKRKVISAGAKADQLQVKVKKVETLIAKAENNNENEITIQELKTVLK